MYPIKQEFFFPGNKENYLSLLSVEMKEILEYRKSSCYELHSGGRTNFV